jgi:hypothetical protein
MAPPIKTYSIEVPGFPPVLFSARTRGKACSRGFEAYSICSVCTFGEFLKLAKVRRVPDPAEVGKRVMIGGQPATTVIGSGQYVAFMRDDADSIFYSHPLDVQPLSTPSGDR